MELYLLWFRYPSFLGALLISSLLVRLTPMYNRGKLSFLRVLMVFLRTIGDSLFLIVCSVLCLLYLSPKEMDYPSFLFSLGVSVVIQDVYPNGNNLHTVRNLMIGAASMSLCQEFNLRCDFNSGGEEKEWDPNLIPLVSNVTDHYIDGRIPIRIYYPHMPHGRDEGGVPSLLWLHGGGFVLGSAEADDFKASLLVNRTKIAVVSVDYSLAPETRFPGAVIDAFDALNWLLYSEEAKRFNLRSDQVFIGGESAGGTLAAAAVAMKEEKDHQTGRDKSVDIKGLLLIYPPLDQNYTNPSYVEHNTRNGVLTATQMKHFWEMYSKQEGGDERSYCNGNDYRLCPALTPSHLLENNEHWPPTWVHVAKLDVLYHEGLKYAEMLRSHGVPYVEVFEYTSTIHAFFFSNIFPSHEEALSLATSRMVEALNGELKVRDGFFTKVPTLL